MPPDLRTLALYPIVASGEGLASRSQATMRDISRYIENGIRQAGEKAVFYASFQQLSRFAPQIGRYREIAPCCERVYVFGVPDWGPPPIDNVVYVPLAAESALAQEWFLVYDAPGYYTGLVARDLTGLGVLRDERTFEGAWTFDAQLVGALRTALERALGVPPNPPPYRDAQQEQQRTLQMINAVVAGLESRNRELHAAYRQVQGTNVENARLQAIVRRYLAGSTWDEAEKSSRDGRATRSQIRAVTVMFTDIVDFTQFSEQHLPHEVVPALNGYFWRLGRVIGQHRGEINKYTGDGVLAVFPDEPSAVAAGREILAELANWNRKRAALGATVLRTRVGIHAGQAIIGIIGGPDRQDRTVLGDTVNTAARLQTQAAPDSLLISEAVYRGAGTPAGFAARGAVALRGKATPIIVYEYPAPPAAAAGPG